MNVLVNIIAKLWFHELIILWEKVHFLYFWYLISCDWNYIETWNFYGKLSTQDCTASKIIKLSALFSLVRRPFRKMDGSWRFCFSESAFPKKRVSSGAVSDELEVLFVPYYCIKNRRGTSMHDSTRPIENFQTKSLFHKLSHLWNYNYSILFVETFIINITHWHMFALKMSDESIERLLGCYHIRTPFRRRSILGHSVKCW